MKLIGVAGKNFSKVGYVFFQLWMIIVAWLVMLIGSWITGWGGIIGLSCPEQSGGDSACFNASGLVRMSFSLAVFQFLIFLICLMKNTVAAHLHDGWWCVKFTFVLALFIGSLWIPNTPVIIGYMQFARAVSVIFLAYQGMLMLIVAYVINNSLVKSVSASGGNAGSCAGITLIALFTILTIGNITWIVFQFIEFSGCGGNIAIMICTCVIGAIMYALVFLKTREDASMFTSSLVLTYCLYLQWSAMSSNQDPTCNPFNSASMSGLNYSANSISMIVLGLLFTFSALFTVSAITKHSDEDNLTTKMNEPLLEDEADTGDVVEDVEEGDKKVTAKEAHVFPITNATITF